MAPLNKFQQEILGKLAGQTQPDIEEPQVETTSKVVEETTEPSANRLNPFQSNLLNRFRVKRTESVEPQPPIRESLPEGELSPKERKSFHTTQKFLIKAERKMRRLGVPESQIERAKQPIYEKILRSGAFKNTMQVLEKLRIPQFMLFNTLRRVQELELSPESLAQGLVAGFTGKEKTEFKDLSDKALDELTSSGFLKPIHRDAIKANPVYKGLAFAQDVIVDPLFPTGISFFGKTTKLGKLSKLKTSAKAAGATIKLDSRVAKKIANYYKVEKATPELIRKVPGLAPTVSEQVDIGQKALITFFGRPVIKGKGIIEATNALKTKVGRSKVIQDLKSMATTRTGLKKLDEIVTETRKLIDTGVEKAIEEGIEIGKRLKGVDVEQVNLISKILDEGLDYRVVENLDDAAKIASKGKKILKPGVVLADVKGKTIGLQPRSNSTRIISLSDVNRLQKELGVKTKKELNTLLKRQRIDGVIDDVGKRTRNKLQILNKNAFVEVSEPFQKEIGVLPEVAEVTEKVRTIFQQVKDTEKLKGVLKSEIENYFPRIATKAAKESLEESGKKIGFNILRRGARTQFAKGRKTIELSLDDFNKIKAEGGDVAEFFTKDPAVALTIRRSGSVRATALADMLDNFASEFAIKSPKALRKGVEISGIDRLKGLKFEPQVAKQIESVFDNMANPVKMGEFTRMYNRVQDWWKGWTLGIFPQYHVRNQVGNLWNNFVGGVTDPNRYLQAFKISKGMNGHVITEAGEKKTFDQLRKLVKKWNIEGTGMYGADIPELLKSAISGEDFSTVGKALKTTFGTLPEAKSLSGKVAKKAVQISPLGPRQNQLMKLGFTVGRALENNARVTHFVDRLIKGDTAAEAAESVARHLFDYSDLTKFEKKLKVWMPFVKWTKQNVPLQAAALFQQPHKFSAIAKARSAIEGQPEQLLYPELPHFIRENMPIRVRTTEEGNHEYFLLGGWLPAADLEKLFSPLDSTMQLLGPIPRTAAGAGLEGLIGFSAPGAVKAFEEEQQKPTSFLGLNLPKGKANLLKNVRLLNELDRLNPGDVFGTPDKRSVFGEFRFDKRGEGEETNKLLRALTGLKTFETSPARDLLFNRRSRAQRFRSLIAREKRRAEEERKRKRDRSKRK